MVKNVLNLILKFDRGSIVADFGFTHAPAFVSVQLGRSRITTRSLIEEANALMVTEMRFC